MKKDKIKVVQYGCGPIGMTLVRYAAERPNIEIVGAIDIVNVGCELGELSGFGRSLGVYISNDADVVLSQTKPDVILLTTGSSLKDVFPQLKQCIRAGANVISSAEELVYPYRKQPELATEIDKLCKQFQVTALGTGVNPGFLMDTWALFMTGVCRSVERIKVVRIQDASHRRIPFQKKIGAGCSPQEFKKLVDTGKIRHVGLEESIRMIADGLGWELDRITEDLTPIVAETEVRSDYLIVKPGEIAGVKQISHGFKKDNILVTLDFQAYIGAKEPHDTVYIEGSPHMEVTIKGGTHGDIATGAMIVNSIQRVLEAPPGLTTMKDMPIISALGSYV